MTRTIISVCSTLIFLISILHVQSVNAQKFEGGVMAGLCASQVAGDTYSGYNKAGIFAGSYVALHLSDRTALRLELDYIQKGSRKNADYDKEDYASYLIRLGYIEMPLLLQIKYGNKIIAEAGPSIAFLMHSYEEVDKVGIDGTPFSKQNLNIIAGVSYLLNERVSLGLRTDNSLFSIRAEKRTGDIWRFWGYGQFNDVLVLNLSYKL